MSAGPPGISDKRWSLSTSLSSVGKEFSCNAGDPGLISGLGRSAGEGIAYSSIFWASLIQKTKIMASGPITSWEIDGKIVETVSDFYFGGAPKSLQMVIAAMKLKDAYSLGEKL